MGEGPPRRRHLLTAAATALVSFGLFAAADDLARLVDALRTGRTFKVRIQAAAALARFRDPRVVTELARAATGDRHPAVRVYTVRLLGRTPGADADGSAARVAIRRALDDRRADVRAQAQRSLDDLARRRAAARPIAPAPPLGRTGEVLVAVGAVADRTGRASAGLKAALRAAIAANLQTTPGVRVAALGAPGVAYAIDATIAKLTLGGGGLEVEVGCAVELVVSRPPRGIMLIASGDAAVVEPRRSLLQPARRESLEIEALTHAVKSAHENLARFFAGLR